MGNQNNDFKDLSNLTNEEPSTTGIMKGIIQRMMNEDGYTLEEAMEFLGAMIRKLHAE